MRILGQPHQNHSINFYQAFMLIYMQKINIISLFFKILQRNSKLVTLGIWACLATHTYNNSINLKKPLPLFLGKKSTSSLTFSLRYCKPVGLGILDMHGYAHLKAILSTCRKLSCLSTDKKSTSSSTFLWRFCKEI